MTGENMIAEAIELMKQKVSGFTGKGSSKFDSTTWGENQATEDLLKLKSNLPEILEVLRNLNGEITYRKFIQGLGEQGLLSVPVSVWKGEDVPSLQIRWNRFLSWFRGYRFQVSDNDNGDGDRGGSATTLSFDLNVGRALPKHLRPIIAFSHISQAVSMYDEFFDEITGNPELFNDFVNSTENLEKIHCKNFDLVKFLGNFVHREDMSEYAPLFQVTLCADFKEQKDMAFGMMSFGKNFVAFTYLYKYQWKVFEFPECPDEEKDQDNIFWDFDISTQTYYSTMWKRVAWALTLTEGITGNYQYVYPKSNSNLGLVDRRMFASVSDADNMGKLEVLCETKAKILFGPKDNEDSEIPDLD